jgi:uncharacterized membrane protein YczE
VRPSFLRPIPGDRRSRRFITLFAGLMLYGISDGLLLAPGLGADPWDVLNQGLDRRLGGGVGTWAVIIGALVLLAWLPLRQRPGVGTLCNIVVVGSVLNLTLAWCPPIHGLPARLAVVLFAIGLNAMATGLYIGAGLGPGPRDGLMTGIVARGHRIRVVRTSIEVSVLALGWLLGGTVGIGTAVYALAIGPLVHLTIPRLALSRVVAPAPVSGARSRACPDPA